MNGEGVSRIRDEISTQVHDLCRCGEIFPALNALDERNVFAHSSPITQCGNRSLLPVNHTSCVPRERIETAKLGYKVCSCSRDVSRVCVVIPCEMLGETADVR